MSDVYKTILRDARICSNDFALLRFDVVVERVVLVDAAGSWSQPPPEGLGQMREAKRKKGKRQPEKSWVVQFENEKEEAYN